MVLCIYCIVIINGFCMMSFEMLASKIIAPYYGNALPIWGTIISLFMVSLAIGAMIGGVISQRRANMNTLLCMLLLLALTSIYFNIFHHAILDFNHMLSVSNNAKMTLSLIALFAPFTIVSGMITPYAIQILTNTGKQSGFTAGLVYFISTLACALGTIATSFYLVVLFSIDTIIMLNTSALLTVTLLTVLFLKRHWFYSDGSSLKNPKTGTIS